MAFDVVQGTESIFQLKQTYTKPWLADQNYSSTLSRFLPQNILVSCTEVIFGTYVLQVIHQNSCAEMLPIPNRPHQLWCPPSLSFNGYRGKSVSTLSKLHNFIRYRLQESVEQHLHFP